MDVWVLYRHELRSALREPNIIVNSLLVPLALYPLLLWLISSGFVLAVGQAAALNSRIAVVGPAPAALLDALRKDTHISLQPPPPDVEAAVRSGALDAGLICTAKVPAGNVDLHLVCDLSTDRSTMARQRIVDATDGYRDQWLKAEAEQRSITGADWERFRIVLFDIAANRDVAAFVVAMVVPATTLLMVTLGAFHPAIDATAGERERSTWETTLGLGVPRGHVLLAKYLYVATAGAVAGLLNMAALGLATASMLSGLMRDSTVQFSVSPWAVVTLALGTVVVALLVSALMLVAGALARSFKEGQAVLTPILLIISLAMLLVTPHTNFTWQLACLPLINVMLVFRDALQNVVHVDLVAVTLVVSLLAVGLALLAARWILQFEEVASGSYAGTLGTLLRAKLRR